MKKPLLIILLIPIVILLILVSYTGIKNSVFYSHPAYLPSAVEGNSLDVVGPGDLDPIIDFKSYQYICDNSGVNLSIRQYRTSKESGYRSNDLDEIIVNNSSYQTFSGKNYSANDFLAGVSETTNGKENYVFTEYSLPNYPTVKIYRLSWQTNNVTVDMEANTQCIGNESEAESELLKIAASMN